MTREVRMRAPDIGIRKLLGLHHYVRDLEQSRRFYVDSLQFSEVGRSSEALEAEGRQRSLAFKAGEVLVVCSTPAGVGGRAARYLERHPDGIGSIVFEVENIRRAFRLLEQRGGTPLAAIQTMRDASGTIDTFSIATPFGDTTIRFIERRGYRGLFPGMDLYDTPRGGNNEFGFVDVDHVTLNFHTMKPALLWLEHVLGFDPLWEVEFHSGDVAKDDGIHGSGLRSKVMWDPSSGVKFASNEPLRPSFKNSQISMFHEEHRGDGVQHVALSTRNIVETVGGLRARGVPFMKTPMEYYDLLPERLKRMGIDHLDEDLRALKELEILVDGSGRNSYLLQIFIQNLAELHGTRDAGPFFYEVIFRKGDRGFGAGNFRALFDSIERQSTALAARRPGVPLPQQALGANFVR
jgi:4-hydroxyphenylpyruvate dioxygenase